MFYLVLWLYVMSDIIVRYLVLFRNNSPETNATDSARWMDGWKDTGTREKMYPPPPLPHLDLFKDIPSYRNIKFPPVYQHTYKVIPSVGNLSLKMEKPWGNVVTHTFLISTRLRSPQPLLSVLVTTASGYSRLWKRWLLHFSPTGHTLGWHSYISMRLRHSVSEPHGKSESGLHSQRWISDKSALLMCTLPIGWLVWKQRCPNTKLHISDVTENSVVRNSLKLLFYWIWCYTTCHDMSHDTLEIAVWSWKIGCCYAVVADLEHANVPIWTCWTNIVILKFQINLKQ